MRSLGILLIVIGAWLHAEQSVSANQWRAPRWNQDAAALAVSHAMWPEACYPVKIIWADLPGDIVGSSNYIGPVVPACEISVDNVVKTMGFTWRCSIIAHEVGHLAGQLHSDDPTNVMYWESTEQSMAPQCRLPIFGWSRIAPYTGRRDS